MKFDPKIGHKKIIDGMLINSGTKAKRKAFSVFLQTLVNGLYLVATSDCCQASFSIHGLPQLFKTCRSLENFSFRFYATALLENNLNAMTTRVLSLVEP